MADKYLQFISTSFNYIPSTFQGLADELIFIENSSKQVYKISFPINEGWFKSANNNVIPPNQDYVIGVVRGKFKSFAIVQGNKRIEYTKQDIDSKNLIY